MKHGTAIVTGAGQGIGFEICRQLASRGVNVLLNDLDETLALKAAQKINEEFGNCYGLAGDASNPAFIQEMVDTAVQKFGRLTIAVANAGITLFGDFLDYPPDDLYKVLHTNVGGTFLLAQAAIRQMKIQGEGGSVLFMSSVTGHQAHKKLAAYSMSKAAIEMLAKNLVIEVSEWGINVNTIAPGATLTERTRHEADYEEIWSRITPMQRPATPADVANTALFLVSDEARHITGQTVIVDGGWTCVSPSPYKD
ncbi:MAG TPA: SDR family oxidoreductase [Chitinophagaceae bacterium]|nr:SDR family oxidoreductase [Chitinophagaceae bacterium]